MSSLRDLFYENPDCCGRRLLYLDRQETLKEDCKKCDGYNEACTDFEKFKRTYITPEEALKTVVDENTHINFYGDKE